MLTRLAALLRSLSLSLQLHQVCIKQQALAEHARPDLDAVWPCWAIWGCQHRSRGATPLVMPLHNHRFCQKQAVLSSKSAAECGFRAGQA